MENIYFPSQLRDFCPLTGPSLTDGKNGSLSQGNARNKDGYPTLIFVREASVALAE